MFAIHDGPFAGTSFTFQEAIQSLVGPEQIEKAAILMPALNQAFLKHYDPKAGWAVVIEGAMVGIDMTPLQTESLSGQPVPCAKFDAKLICPAGRTLATASSLWTICGPTSWEKGETNARLRLYEASGLQTRFEVPQGVDLAKPPALKGAGTAAKSVAIPAGTPRKGGGMILQFRPFVEPSDKNVAPQVAAVVVADSTPVADVPVAVDAVEPEAKTTAGKVVAAAAADAASDTKSAVEAKAAAAAVVSAKGESPVKGQRGKPKKRELDRDAPISPELLERCRTMARMKFKKLPEMSNTGEALDFMKSLG